MTDNVTDSKLCWSFASIDSPTQSPSFVFKMKQSQIGVFVQIFTEMRIKSSCWNVSFSSELSAADTAGWKLVIEITNNYDISIDGIMIPYQILNFI